MALHPMPFDPVRRGGVEQLLPELGILDRLPVGGPPAVLAPAVDPFGDAVADIDAVGVELRPGRAASAPRARGSRPAAPSGCWWSAARRRTAPSRARPRGSRRPSRPGPGLPLQAPSVKISTSVSSAVTPLRGPRGSLKTIRSSTPSTGSSVTSKRSPRQSTTSRTSTSGAEAPAVMPSVRTPSSQAKSMSAPRADQPGAGALALGDLDQAQRVGAVRRADHQHRVAARRRSP